MREIEEIVTSDFIKFIEEHHRDDTAALILSGKRYPSIDVKLAVTTIEARRKLLTKVPEWGERFDLYYPSALAAEQASSLHTALYKRQFINGGTTIDLTGGIGIDSYYMSQKAGRLIYIERNSDLCEATKYNFEKLGVKNIEIFNREVTEDNISSVIAEILSNSAQTEEEQSITTIKREKFNKSTSNNNVSANRDRVKLIYLDPARRGENDKRIYAISDCEPDITALKEHLFEFTESILVKASPMADISSLLKELTEVSSVHILSVENECKELLLLLTRAMSNSMDNTTCNRGDIERTTIGICCINFVKKGGIQSFCFTHNEERSARPEYAESIKRYLYEPNSSILKGGAFKSISCRFDIAKLEKSTHLYTSDIIIKEFPGKIFEIKEVIDYSNNTIRNLNKFYPKANISVRNFPISANELKKRADIEDGGNIQLIGTTMLSNGGSIRKIVVCERL